MWLLQDVPGQTHITPMEDLRPHDPQANCWCRPVEDAEFPHIWVHKSLDGREAYESGERPMQ